MKIYCVTCCDYILDTSEVFKLGGPYNGGMFKESTHVRFQYDYFQFHRAMTSGNLVCPRCSSAFIRNDGALMSEYGLIMPGQESLDKTFSAIHPPDHPEAPGCLKGRDIKSREGKDLVWEAANERQEMIDAFEKEALAEPEPEKKPVTATEVEQIIHIHNRFMEEYKEPIEVPSATRAEIKREEIRERNREIKKMKDAGKTHREIADRFDVSMSTIAVVLSKKRNKKRG